MMNYMKKMIAFFVLFVSFFFSSCEKELYEEAIVSSQKNRNIIATTKTFKELNSNFKFNSAYNKISSKLKTKGINNKLLYDVNVDTSKVNVVFLDKYSSYSFKIIEVENGQDYYKNLLIEIDSLDRVSAKILRYNEDIEKRIASINEIIVIPKIEEEVSSSESAAKCEWIEVTTQTQCSGQEHHWPGEPDCVPQDATSHTTLYLNCGGSDVSYVPNFPTISVPSQQQNGASISYPVSNSNELKMRRFLNSLKLDQREFFTSLPIASQDAIYLHLIATNFLTSGRVKSFILNMISNNLDSYFYGNLSDSSANIGLEQSVNNIITYLIQNGFNQQSTAFVNESITQIIQNPTVFNSITPFLIEKKIDDSQLDDCSKSVFQQIKNTTNCDFANVFAKLGANDTIYKTTLETEHNNDFNGDEVTDPANTTRTVQGVKYDYTVYVNPNYSGKTKLYIAAFLLHEMAHTYFFSLLDDYNTGVSNSFNELPILYNALVSNHMSFNPSLTHEEIANSYVNAISDALKEFQPGLNQQVYDDLAWSGLEKTDVFNTLHPQGSSSRERILNRKAAEQTGNPVGQGTSNQQNPLGQSCN